MNSVAVVTSERLARYGFGDGHPFGPDRLAAFSREFAARGLLQRVTLLEPRDASAAELESFHTAEYLEFVRERSASGTGLLDGGDTPAFRGVYEAAAGVVGATLTCMEAIMQERCRRAFVPIAGLHHAARNRAAGFCVFNDCGVAIEQLKRAGLEHIALQPLPETHLMEWLIYEPDGSRRSLPRNAELLESGAEGAKLKMPKGGGIYRLFVYVTDAHGGAAVGNVILKVKGPAIDEICRGNKQNGF